MAAPATVSGAANATDHCQAKPANDGKVRLPNVREPGDLPKHDTNQPDGVCRNGCIDLGGLWNAQGPFPNPCFGLSICERAIAQWMTLSSLAI